MPVAEYFALSALNVSLLKELRRSPLHFRHAMQHPKRSPAMTLGTAAHTATLEPERFDRSYTVWNRRTDSGRLAPRTGKAWDAFVAESAGRDVLTEDEAIAALNIAQAVRGDPVAIKYLEAGDPEVTMQWSWDGRNCKARADWITQVDGEAVLVGLKTTRDCRHFPFAAQAARLGYHLQWSWYLDGYVEINGQSPRVVEIVVESEPPHAVVVYAITEDVLAQGRQEYRELLDLLAACEARDEWPGPATTEHVLSLPSWVYGSDEDVSDLGLEG
jgi:hypothetical protein